MLAASAWQALDRLADRLGQALPEELPVLAAETAVGVGAVAAQVYLVDYDQVALMPQPVARGSDGGEAESVPIDGTMAGRAYSTGLVQRGADEAGPRWWLPLVDGSDRVGVLEVTTTAERGGDEELLRRLQTLATLLAEMIVARRQYGDVLERSRRRQPMQVAAEIIWTQLPPLTFMTGDAAVAAILEPCYDIGGDAFDYAANGAVMHVAIFDAVGHGIGASAQTSLAVSAYRNARRCGLDLVDTYRSIDKWVHAQHPDGHVTALLGELDTASGCYRRISAGHPGELLLRDGRLVRELPAPTAMPLGLGYLQDPIPQVTHEALEPGDRLLLYTDGVVEARTADGVFFGVDRLVDLVTKALADELPAPETMRRLVRSLLAHQHEEPLQDDATAMLLHWRPGQAGYGQPR